MSSARRKAISRRTGSSRKNPRIPPSFFFAARFPVVGVPAGRADSPLGLDDVVSVGRRDSVVSSPGGDAAVRWAVGSSGWPMGTSALPRLGSLIGLRGGPNAGGLSKLPNPRSLPPPLAEVVELGAADPSSAHHLDPGNRR